MPPAKTARMQKSAHMPELAPRLRGRACDSMNSQSMQHNALTQLTEAVGACRQQPRWYLVQLEVDAGKALPVSQAACGAHAIARHVGRQVGLWRFPPDALKMQHLQGRC
jgi:hypothetical protein